MKIHGAEGMSAFAIRDQLDRGAKFVVYQYCISFIFITYKRSSSIYFIKSDDNAFLQSLQWSLLTTITGWWGIPWGPINTIESLITNFGGGKNVTKQVLAEVYT